MPALAEEVDLMPWVDRKPVNGAARKALKLDKKAARQKDPIKAMMTGNRADKAARRGRWR
jgi:hypothetical protein